MKVETKVAMITHNMEIENDMKKTNTREVLCVKTQD